MEEKVVDFILEIAKVSDKESSIDDLLKLPEPESGAKKKSASKKAPAKKTADKKAPAKKSTKKDDTK